MKKETVYIVHCVDAEGPLFESLEATFDRLKDIFGISLPPSRETLDKIQNGRIDLGGVTDLVAQVFSPYNLGYNDSWEKIDAMLKVIMSEGFRNELRDSFGGGWIYNWFCLDHVGFESNPRRRALGYHAVHDFYTDAKRRYASPKDGVQIHFHPMSVYREAHRCATSYTNSPHIYEVLCRRIIERKFFPAAVRAGFHTERPDSNLFFEQWFPFDFSNWAFHSNSVLELQLDTKEGRLGDWRLAPDDWSIYHPHHDNWQLPGSCRRWIARGIDIFTRGRDLSQEEVDKAFGRADSGKPAVVGCVSHDFRDVAYELKYLRERIHNAAKKYPDVKFKFCEAVDGFSSAAYGYGKRDEPLKLKLGLERSGKEMTLKVETVKGKVFGPQPFLAVRTKAGRFIHENLDFDPSLTKWYYTFDLDSIRSDDVEEIGVGASDRYGNSFAEVIRP